MFLKTFIEEDFEDLFNIVLQVKKQQYVLWIRHTNVLRLVRIKMVIGPSLLETHHTHGLKQFVCYIRNDFLIGQKH